MRSETTNPGSKTTNPGSETTNPGSETTNPEQNGVLEPSGRVPESENLSKIQKNIPGSGSIFRIQIRKGPRRPKGVHFPLIWGALGAQGPPYGAPLFSHMGHYGVLRWLLRGARYSTVLQKSDT